MEKIMEEIKEADADYVLALKGNQETVHAEVKTFLDQTLLERQGPRLPGAKLSPAAATLANNEENNSAGLCRSVGKDVSRSKISTSSRK